MNKREILIDYKKFENLMGELDHLADRGYSYEDMYTDNIEEINKYARKYGVEEIDETKIDWEWCNYIQNIEWLIEKRMEELILKGE